MQKCISQPHFFHMMYISNSKNCALMREREKQRSHTLSTDINPKHPKYYSENKHDIIRICGYDAAIQKTKCISTPGPRMCSLIKY